MIEALWALEVGTVMSCQGGVDASGTLCSAWVLFADDEDVCPFVRVLAGVNEGPTHWTISELSGNLGVNFPQALIPAVTAALRAIAESQ